MRIFDSSQCEQLQDRIGYHFQNLELLYSALTHTSWTYEQKSIQWDHQERLEFLGDAVLEFTISNYLYGLEKKYPEGKMTSLRQLIVREETLAALGQELNIGPFLLLGHGEKQSGGEKKSTNLEDAMEALFAAIYLDSSMEIAQKVILTLLEPWIRDAMEGRLIFDYKSRILEVIQETDREPEVTWIVQDETGPAHARLFTIELRYNGKALATGQGRTKKHAEQAAAKEALQLLQAKD